jgi:DNA-binding NtrC family response regulator
MNNFRRDLYYRLSVVALTIPPLRERREDVPRLADDMLAHYRSEIPYHIDGITSAAHEALAAYEWPGNVRELMNVIERAVLLTTDDQISLDDLPANIGGLQTADLTQLPSPEVMEEERLSIPTPWLALPLRKAREKLLTEFERAYLTAQLEATKGRVGQTAQRAGIRSRSLYEKMKRLGLHKETFRRKKTGK